MVDAMIDALRQRAEAEGLDIDFSNAKDAKEAMQLYTRHATKQRASEIVEEAVREETPERPNSNTVETENGKVISDYDSEGRIISEMIQDKDGKPLQLQQTDSQGRTSTSVFSYDENGNHNATAHFKDNTVEYTYFKDGKPVETPDLAETLAIEKDVSASMRKANQVKDEQMEGKDKQATESIQASLDDIEQRFMNEIHAQRAEAEEIKQAASVRQQGYSDKPVSYETVNKDGSRTVSSYDEAGSTVSHYNKDNILIKESVQSRDGERAQTTIYGNDGEILMRHTKDGEKVTMTAQKNDGLETEDLTAKKEAESSLEETTVLPAVRRREAERGAQTAVPVSAPASNKKINEDEGEYVEFEEIIEEPKTQAPQEVKVEEVVAEEVQAPEMTTMPAPVKPRGPENTAEEVNTAFPAVREAAAPAVKTAQTTEEKALALTDKEKDLAKGFIEYASVQNKEKSDSYVKSMEVAVRDYMAQGLTPAQIQEKVSNVLAVAQSVAQEQGLADPEALKALEKQATEGMAKLFSQVAPHKDSKETVLEAAPEKAPVKMLEDAEAEKAAREKAAAEAEKAAKAKAEAEKAAAEAEKTKAEKPADEQVGTFGAAEADSKDKDKKKGKGDKAPVIENDLLKQVQNVAMLNRYYGFEAEKDSPPRPNPFQTITKAEKSPKGVKPPYAYAELASGAKMYNRPDSVDMVYKTQIMQDGSENSQLSFEDCMTMVRLGQQKGWTAAKLTGPKEFREQMYLACRAMGMPVKDFQPSPELQKLGDEKEAMHEATRAHVKNLDARFPQMEAERKNNKLSYNDVNYEFMDYLNDKGLGLPKPERKKYKGEKTAEKNVKKEAEEKTEGEKEEKPKTKGRERKEKAEKILETAVTEKITAEAAAEEVKGGPVKPKEEIVAESKVETQKLLAAPKGPAEVLQEAGQKLIEAKGTKVNTDLKQQRMLALPEKTETKALPAVISKEITDRAVAKR